MKLGKAGAQLIGLQRGIVDGEKDVVFSTQTVTNNGSSLTVEGDWSAINPTSYRIDIFANFARATLRRNSSSAAQRRERGRMAPQADLR